MPAEIPWVMFEALRTNWVNRLVRWRESCRTRVRGAGAGPAGLTTTVALERQGIQVLLVERRRDFVRAAPCRGH
jgi:NADPH-dependent glutamate synthase beta subunit-like oxidoreductase